MTTDAAGPREQAIRERLLSIAETATPYVAHWIREGVALLDALRPEEPPLQSDRERQIRERLETDQSLLAFVGWSKADVAWLLDEVASLRAQLTQLTDQAYRIGEWECISGLLADREEMTVYLKVEGLLNEHEAMRAQLTEAQQEAKDLERDVNLWIQRAAVEADRADDAVIALTEAQQARDQLQQVLWPDGKRYFLNGKPCAPEAQTAALQRVMLQHDAERIRAAEATLASLWQLPEKWRRREAATLRKSDGQIFRVCAGELDAALAGAGPTPPQEPT